MEKEVAKVHISKEGDCRIYLRRPIVEVMHLKSGDYLKVEIDKVNKKFIVTKIE